MAVKSTTSAGSTIITLTGRFDLYAQMEFEKAYQNIDPESDIIIDLAEAIYIDSSVMGALMLLLSHVKAGSSAEKRIKLLNANDELKEVLRISNFQQIFDIE
jgi:HptB-dependent secretion and biofilm anti anti-sigma factor